MKKYLKSAGIIPCLIISLCLILMLMTCAVYYRNPSTGSTGNFYGQDVMYVYASTKSSYDSLLGYRSYLVRDEPSAAALVSFIFLSMSSISLFQVFTESFLEVYYRTDNKDQPDDPEGNVEPFQ